MIIRKFEESDIKALTELSETDDFPYTLTAEAVAAYCRGNSFSGEGVQTYGVFEDDKPLSVMTATFCRVFPCVDSPRGRIVHLSGAFTLPKYRNKGYALALLKRIEADAERFCADYLCCDSTADGFYRSFGFDRAPDDETRMWKRISENKEALS